MVGIGRAFIAHLYDFSTFRDVFMVPIILRNGTERLVPLNTYFTERFQNSLRHPPTLL